MSDSLYNGLCWSQNDSLLVDPKMAVLQRRFRMVFLIMSYVQEELRKLAQKLWKYSAFDTLRYCIMFSQHALDRLVMHFPPHARFPAGAALATLSYATGVLSPLAVSPFLLQDGSPQHA